MAKLTTRGKHLKRIRQQIRRMEKRGYVVDPDFKASLSGRSARSLAQLKTESLYKRSTITGVDVVTGEKRTFSGIEGRKIERRQAAKAAAETRKLKKQKPRAAPLYSEEMPDISTEIIDNLDALLFRLSQPVAQMAEAKDGHLFPKSNSLVNYSQGAKNRLQQVLDEEVRRINASGRNGEAIVASRIYDHSDEIDQAIGIIEYSAYIGSIQTAIMTFIRIIRGFGSYDKQSIEVQDLIETESESWEEM